MSEHLVCDCAPDCAERIACQRVGELGHFACGWCGEHEQANHICLCLTRVRHHTVADTLAAEDRVRAEDGHIGGRL